MLIFVVGFIDNYWPLFNMVDQVNSPISVNDFVMISCKNTGQINLGQKRNFKGEV